MLLIELNSISNMGCQKKLSDLLDIPATWPTYDVFVQ